MYVFIRFIKNVNLTNSDIINEGFNILKKDVEELEKNLILKK